MEAAQERDPVHPGNSKGEQSPGDPGLGGCSRGGKSEQRNINMTDIAIEIKQFDPQGDPAVEASTIGLKPGEIARVIIYDGEVFEFLATGYTAGAREIAGWRYAAPSGRRLFILND
jgi:hypothetical protein